MIMPDELTKRAVDMLLGGATLLSEPCPYCKGVRVMKNGNALCVSCGKQPEKRSESPEDKEDSKNESSPVSYTHLRAHETREDLGWRGGG